MKLWQRILLTVLAAFLTLSVALPAYARGADDPSPLPGWLAWLLQLIGIETSTPSVSPTPAFTPTASIAEYRIASLKTLEELPGLLLPGKPVRAYATAADVQAMVSEYLSTPKAAKNGLLSGSVTLLEGSVRVQGQVSRARIEKEGIPVFLNGETIAVQGEGSVQAVDCRPQISLTTVKMQEVSVPLANLIAQLLNEALREEWPPEICLESVTISAQQISAQGYKR